MVSSISECGIEIDTGMYPEAVVFKCFYWYTGIYDVVISPASSSTIQVSLKPKPGGTWEPITLIEQIKRDLVDFKLRDIVTKETQTVRELIIAKAFAYADLTHDPVTEVSDPVGFHPASVS